MLYMEDAVGGACVENFDCFPRMGGKYLQREPVDNCIRSSLSFMPLDLINLTTRAVYHLQVLPTCLSIC